VLAADKKRSEVYHYLHYLALTKQPEHVFILPKLTGIKREQPERSEPIGALNIVAPVEVKGY